MAETLPHLDHPTVEQLEELVTEHAQPVRETYSAPHRVAIAAVTPHTRWATLTLLGGAQLPDPTSAP